MPRSESAPPSPTPAGLLAEECGHLAVSQFISVTEPAIWKLGEVPREIPGSRMTQVLIHGTSNDFRHPVIAETERTFSVAHHFLSCREHQVEEAPHGKVLWADQRLLDWRRPREQGASRRPREQGASSSVHTSKLPVIFVNLSQSRLTLKEIITLR